MNPLNPQSRRLLPHIPASVFLSAIAGLFIALLISVLLAFPLSMLPDLWGDLAPVVASLVLCLIIVPFTVLKGRALFQLFGISLPEARMGRPAAGSGKLIVDTSALIDGRIADIGQAGFLPATLVIPRFVLEELQHIADSYDATRRNRGRRGLEILNRLQQEEYVPVEISDMEARDIPEVDGKLIKLAKAFGYAILTNDFNLNQVARIQGLQVLNVNELANAVRPVVLPGEEMEVRIIQEGKELRQGIGFLDDGTMIVVEDGRKYMDNDVDVVVTRVLQTTAGRMIFAHPKAG